MLKAIGNQCTGRGNCRAIWFGRYTAECMRSLCDRFDLVDELDMRPSDLHALVVQQAVTIRELAKEPEILLLELPEDFIWQTDFESLDRNFQEILTERCPVVFFSYDRNFERRYSNRRLRIESGCVYETGKKATD